MLLKSGGISYARVVALSKNKDGFGLILEDGLTKRSMNRLICETLKKQYVFGTKFALSARVPGDWSSRLDIYLQVYFIS